MRRIWILVPAALLLAACGGSTKSSTSAGPALQTIHVSEKEYSLTPSTISVPQTGTYSFQITNKGTITHAFEIEGNGVEAKSQHIQPGQSAALTVKLSKKGSYEAYCPIDGHRSLGMKAKLSVGTAAPATTTTGQTTSTSTNPGY